MEGMCLQNKCNQIEEIMIISIITISQGSTLEWVVAVVMPTFNSRLKIKEWVRIPHTNNNFGHQKFNNSSFKLTINKMIKIKTIQTIWMKSKIFRRNLNKIGSLQYKVTQVRKEQNRKWNKYLNNSNKWKFQKFVLINKITKIKTK